MIGVLKMVYLANYEQRLTQKQINSFILPIKDKLVSEATFLLGLWSQLDYLARKYNPAYNPQDLVREFYENFHERRCEEACMEVVINDIAKQFYPAACKIDVHYTAPFEQWFSETYAPTFFKDKIFIHYWRPLLVGTLWQEMKNQLDLVVDFSEFPIVDTSPYGKHLNLEKPADRYAEIEKWSLEHKQKNKVEEVKRNKTKEFSGFYSSPITQDAWEEDEWLQYEDEDEITDMFGNVLDEKGFPIFPDLHATPIEKLSEDELWSLANLTTPELYHFGYSFTKRELMEYLNYYT